MQKFDSVPNHVFQETCHVFVKKQIMSFKNNTDNNNDTNNDYNSNNDNNSE